MKNFSEIRNLKSLWEFAKKNPLTDLLDFIIKFLLIWRIKHLSTKRFLIILSIITGICAGLAAVTMKSGVHLVEGLVQNISTLSYKTLIITILPMIGVVLTTFFFRQFVKKGKRVDLKSVLYAISRGRGNISGSGTYSSVVGSSITAGSGGSIGLEAPIVTTGAAIGSNVGKVAHLGHKSKILLIGCGVAGGIAAVFGTPITGVIFALEVLMLELNLSSIIPLLLAAVSGSLTTEFFLQDDLILKFPQELSFFRHEIPFFIIMGVMSGFSSLYLTRMKVKMGRVMQKVKNAYVRSIIGGLCLSVLIFFFPSLSGEGYTSIKNSFALDHFGWLDLSHLFPNFYSHGGIVVVGLLLVVFFLKGVATSVTIGAGGEGGIIAPALGLGSILGLLFFQIITLFFPQIELTYTAYVLLGMCGLISGAFHAPLTSVFLIAEATESYELLIPLIIVSSFSFLLVRYYENHSLYTTELAKKNQLLSHDKDKAILSLMNIETIIDKKVMTLDYDNGLEEALKIVKRSSKNFYPVIDQERNFYGIIYFEDLKDQLFESKKESFISQITNPPTFVNEKDNMEQISLKFEKTETWYLPYLIDGKYGGMISKSTFLDKYRKLLKKMGYNEDSDI